jgi:hypothetical protein
MQMLFGEESLDFMQDAERKSVLRIMKEIVESDNPLYIGGRVSELHTILAPNGLFLKAIQATRLVRRTAYGYMYGFRNVNSALPAGAVQAMIERKVVINPNRKGGEFGEYTKAIELVPPPKSGTPSVYLRWVDEMIAAKPKRLTGNLANTVRKSPEDALIECYQMLERIGKRLPPQPAVRKDFARNLIRLTMKKFDLEPDRFSPAKVTPMFPPSRSRSSAYMTRA